MTRTIAIARWGMLLGALLVVGPALGWAQSAFVLSGDGGPAATALVSSSVVVGVLMTAACFAVAGVFGVLTAKICGPRFGLVGAGFVLLGPAWTSGTMVDLLRWADGAGTMFRLAAEGVLVGGLGVVCAAAIARAGKADEHDGAESPLSPSGVLGLSVAIAAGAAAAWLVAREPLKGQTIGAGIVAGMASGLLGRSIAHKAPALTFIVAGAALAIVAPALAGVLHGGGALRAVYDQTFVPIGLLMPMEWVAGAFVGAPIGMTWAASMTERKSH